MRYWMTRYPPLGAFIMTMLITCSIPLGARD
jgi:hypothetical protein